MCSPAWGLNNVIALINKAVKSKKSLSFPEEHASAIECSPKMSDGFPKLAGWNWNLHQMPDDESHQRKTQCNQMDFNLNKKKNQQFLCKAWLVKCVSGMTWILHSIKIGDSVSTNKKDAIHMFVRNQKLATPHQLAIPSGAALLNNQKLQN